MGAPVGDKNGKNGFSHLREEGGGDPEQRELLLAVGEPLLASTTASPFLTFSLISLPHFDIMTATYQSFPIKSKAPQPMGPWLGGGGESTAQAQPSLAGGKVVAGGKVLAGGKVGSSGGKVGNWQFQVEIRCYYGVDL